MFSPERLGRLFFLRYLPATFIVRQSAGVTAAQCTLHWTHVASPPQWGFKEGEEFVFRCPANRSACPDHFTYFVGKSVARLRRLRIFDTYLGSAGKEWATGDYMHLLGWSDVPDLLRTVGATNWFFHRNKL
jgi:hypothetical protein